jgi:hypothetical protein
MSAVLSTYDDPGYSPDRQIAQLRIPPHSIEAESSVLGGLLLDNGAWDRGRPAGRRRLLPLRTQADLRRHRRPDQRQQAGRRHHRLRAAAEPRQGRRVGGLAT